MRYKNPSTDSIEEVSEFIWVWVLFFGVIYFLIKGVWNHALVWFLLAPITAGISMIAYAYYSREIMHKHYLDKGWNPIEETKS